MHRAAAAALVQLLAMPLQVMAAPTSSSTLELSAGRRLAEGDMTYGIAFGILGFLLLLLCPLTFLPRGYVKMWLKVHLATTNQSSVCWCYLPAETKEFYKEQLAKVRRPGCCVWFKAPLLSEEDLVSAEYSSGAAKTGRFNGRALSVDIEAGGDDRAFYNDVAKETTSVSGKPLGLIPASTESGSAVDLEYVRAKTRVKKRIAHHCTVLLPRDCADGDDTCGFAGFGGPDNPEVGLGRWENETSLREDSDEAPSTQFVFALLDEKGRWLADLPLDPDVGDIVMGKGFKYETEGATYELGGGVDHAISRKQMLVSAADGAVSATPLGPNPSFLQRAKGDTHTAPAQLARGTQVLVLPGDVLWLCRGRYALRLIERLPGNLSVAGGLQPGLVAAAAAPAAKEEALARSSSLPKRVQEAREAAAGKIQTMLRTRRSSGAGKTGKASSSPADKASSPPADKASSPPAAKSEKAVTGSPEQREASLQEASEAAAAAKLQAMVRGKKSRGFASRIKAKPPPALAKDSSSGGSVKRMKPPSELPPGTGRQSIADTREWVNMTSQRNLRGGSPQRQASPTRRQQGSAPTSGQATPSESQC